MCGRIGPVRCRTDNDGAGGVKCVVGACHYQVFKGQRTPISFVVVHINRATRVSIRCVIDVAAILTVLVSLVAVRSIADPFIAIVTRVTRVDDILNALEAGIVSL